jgi:hypothetical protein
MSAALQLVQPDTAELEAEGSILVLRAQSITIKDDETFAVAVEFMNDCASRRKAIVAKFADPKKKAFDAHKAITALEKELLDVVDKAEREAKHRISDYRAEQERAAAAERRRLEEEAKRREEERLLAEAEDLQDAGEDVAAMEILSEPIAPPPVYVPPATPKMAGVQFRETWSAKVVDFMALVRFVAAHPEYVNLLTSNAAALNSIARTLKSAARIDGVQMVAEKTVAAGGRR